MCSYTEANYHQESTGAHKEKASNQSYYNYLAKVKMHHAI